MHDTLSNRSCLCRRVLLTLCLVASWVGGVCIGHFYFRSYEQVFVSLMCSSVRSSVSIVLLLTGVTLPFLITAYSVHYHKVYILFPICFCKAFAYSVAVFAAYGTYGRGGWLMHCLLMFTENVSACLLMFVWLRFVFGKVGLMPTLVRCGCIALVAWSLDIIAVAPFVVSITSF